MRVKVAGTAGFCWGVQRALRELESLEMGDDKFVTYGPLVFNGSVLKHLDDRGISAVHHPDQVPDGAKVIIRPHGAVSDDILALEDREGVELVDLTCPHIEETRRKVRDLCADKKNVIIVGNRDHDEVRVLADAVSTEVHIIADSDEAEELAADEPLALVGQSTYGPASFEDIEETLDSRFESVDSFNTLCGVTEARQRETRELAEESDVLIIVGPYHSGSARRLAEMGRESGKQTFQVELTEDLQIPAVVEQARLARRQSLMEQFAEDPDKLKELADNPDSVDGEILIGVTACASSTPWMIKDIVDVLVKETEAEVIQGLPQDLAAEAHQKRLTGNIGADVADALTDIDLPQDDASQSDG